MFRLKDIDGLRQLNAYSIFLKHGNFDTFAGFLKQFGESLFDSKGNVVECL